MTPTTSEMRLEVLADPQALARQVGDWMLDLASATEGRFAIALAGGSTPRSLYEHLASPPYRDVFPWARTHLFWGDERFVQHDDALSNYRMVREALLSHVPIPSGNVHAVPTAGLAADESARVYERELKSFYGADQLDPGRALFDITLLGLGSDGHTASLFPGAAVLHERDHWVAAVTAAKSQPRITLTYPALESSRHVAFLVVGREKRAIFDQLRQGADSLPAAHLHPTGELCAFVDAAVMEPADPGFE